MLVMLTNARLYLYGFTRATRTHNSVTSTQCPLGTRASGLLGAGLVGL